MDDLDILMLCLVMETWHRIAFPTPKPLDIIQQQMERTNRSGANSIVHKLGIQPDDDGIQLDDENDDDDLAIFLMCVCVFDFCCRPVLRYYRLNWNVFSTLSSFRSLLLSMISTTLSERLLVGFCLDRLD